MSDAATRSASRIATAVAVPVAILVGALVFWLLGNAWGADGGGADGGGAAGGGAAGDGAAGGGATGSPRPGSTEPVTVAAPQLSERAASVCPALLARLPDQLRDLPRRPVTAGTGQNAAYGDPPITLACGAEPAVYPRDALFWGMSKVCWYAEEGPDGSVWTAIDREVPVAVTVPKEYSGAGDLVNEFSGTLIATVPSKPTAEIPSGCR